MVDGTRGDFKRLNFFRGFRTSEADWNEGERYHVEKRRLHHAYLHTSGVVRAALDGFGVCARGRGELAVTVSPGYALDREGHDLFVWSPLIVPLNPAEFKLPTTVYLVARYAEELSDFIAYPEHQAFKGHRRVTELTRVRWSAAAPDAASDVELCRVSLSKDVRRITNARVAHAPDLDEIDLRFVADASAAGHALPRAIALTLADTVARAKSNYAELMHELHVGHAGEVLHALITLQMFVLARQLDEVGAVALLDVVFGHREALVGALEASQPQIACEREFGQYKKHVEVARARLAEAPLPPGILTELVEHEAACLRLLTTVLARRPGQQAAPTPVLSDAIADQIRTWSAPMPPTWQLGEFELRLVDTLDPLDGQSERAHGWRISGERDKYRARQKLKYPDGVVVEDAGIAFEGGELAFELHDLTPGQDVFIVWRMDYAHGDWQVEVQVDGHRMADALCPGNDRKFRWRNWFYVVPGIQVRESTLRVRWTPVTAGRDFNVFKLWAYQPARRS